MPKKANGKWKVDLRPQGHQGKRIRRSFDTRAEALRFEAFVTNEATQSREWNPTAPDTRRFSDLVELWYETHGYFLKEGERRRSVLLAIADAMNDPIAANLTGMDFTRYRKNKKVRGKPANPKTLNNHLGYCNAVFNELIRTDHINYDNPFGKIRPVKLSESELSYLEQSEVRELLEKAKASRNPHLYPMSLLCLSTGCRWGEATNLTRSRVKNGTVTFTDTKGKRNRTIPISDQMQKMLLAHNPKGGNKLFPESSMVAFDRLALKLSFKLPTGQSTHILRHTYAAHFIQNGGDILTLRDILGHVDIKMTMRYAHLAPNHLALAKSITPVSGHNWDTGKL